MPGGRGEQAGDRVGAVGQWSRPWMIGFSCCGLMCAPGVVGVVGARRQVQCELDVVVVGVERPAGFVDAFDEERLAGEAAAARAVDGDLDAVGDVDSAEQVPGFGAPGQSGCMVLKPMSVIRFFGCL